MNTIMEAEDTINKIMSFAVREGVDCQKLRVDHRLFTQLAQSKWVVLYNTGDELVLDTAYGKVKILSRGGL